MKLVTVVSFLMITISILLLHEAPVNGYELSIYDSVSPFVWFAAIFGIANGGLLIYLYYSSRKGLWAIGLFQILLCNMIIISLNALRGSIYLGYGDPLSYVGYSRDIILSGFIPSYNFYPLSSLMVSFTTLTTGLTLIDSVQLFPAILLTVYMLSMFAWSGSICRERGFVATMTFASLPLFFAWFVPPVYYETLFVLMLPVFFFSLQKGRSGDIRFISITFALFVFFTLGHPLVALFILLYIVVIFLVERRSKTDKTTVSSNLVLFSGVVFLAWISLQAILTNQVSSILNSILTLGSSGTTLINFESSASKLGLLSAIHSLLACTIDDIIFMLLALWAAILIWRGAWKSKTLSRYVACLIIGSLFLSGVVVATYVHNPFRLINLNMNMIFSVPLVGYVLYQMRKKGSRFRAGLVISLILIALVASTLSVYQDPLQVYPSGTITVSEASGVNWFIGEKQPDLNTSALQTLPWRFGDMIYGHTYVLGNANSFNATETASHFTAIMSSNRSVQNTYLVVSEFDREAYTKVWQDANIFTENDFKALSFSPMVNQVYVNGEFSVYLRDS